MSDAIDLSGRWRGIFNYPRELPPTEFEVELRDHSGALSGETFEPGLIERGRANAVMTAWLEGTRSGAQVDFIKRYDDLSGDYEAVFYTGQVNADATEIVGNWDIPAVWSGTFLMIRERGAEAAVEHRAAVTVD